MRKFAFAAACCGSSIYHAANVGFAPVYSQRPEQTMAGFSRADPLHSADESEFLTTVAVQKLEVI